MVIAPSGPLFKYQFQFGICKVAGKLKCRSSKKGVKKNKFKAIEDN